MSEQKLSEKLHKAVLDAYSEAQAREGSSRLLSKLQLLIDDEVALLETRLSRMEIALDAANFESLAIDATAASVMLVIRQVLAGGSSFRILLVCPAPQSIQ